MYIGVRALLSYIGVAYIPRVPSIPRVLPDVTVIVENTRLVDGD
jgi:hypothetical protein